MRFAGRWWIVIPAALWAFLFTACIQTTEILQPVDKKPITTAAQGTLTFQLNLTAAEHKNQVFSVLVFQMGTLKAILTDDGSATTDAAGAASVAVKAVDTNNCATATNALLDNGEYNYYFVINYNTLARTAVNTGATGNGCGASGFIDSTAGGTNYTATGKVTVNGDTTLVIDDTKLVQSQKYTLNFITGTTWRFKCYITDSNITSYTSTTPLVSIYTQETGADGLTTGRGGNDNLLAPKGYNYFCYADTNGGGNYFESGTDKLAVGVLPSSIGDMITVPLTQFQDF